jgi:hypothetical protein
MKKGIFYSVLVLLLAFVFVGKTSAAVIHHVNKEVGVIMPPDHRDCVFFQLVGVSAPDPSVSSSAWIAVPRSQTGFNEIYAFLLWAKGTGTHITVETNGQAVNSCSGPVGVWQVYSAS